MAMSVIEHTNANGLSIDVEVGEQNATITDNGRGMKISPDDGESVSHAEKALTTRFPVIASDPEIEAVLRELVWGSQGCDGPSEANTACPELRLFSRRDGEEWTQSYAYGVPVSPPRRVGTTDRAGTTLQLATSGPIDIKAIGALASQLRNRIEGLDLAIVAAWCPLRRRYNG